MLKRRRTSTYLIFTRMPGRVTVGDSGHFVVVFVLRLLSAVYLPRVLILCDLNLRRYHVSFVVQALNTDTENTHSICLRHFITKWRRLTGPVPIFQNERVRCN